MSSQSATATALELAAQATQEALRGTAQDLICTDEITATDLQGFDFSQFRNPDLVADGVSMSSETEIAQELAASSIPRVFNDVGSASDVVSGSSGSLMAQELAAFAAQDALRATTQTPGPNTASCATSAVCADEAGACDVATEVFHDIVGKVAPENATSDSCASVLETEDEHRVLEEQ